MKGFIVSKFKEIRETLLRDCSVTQASQGYADVILNQLQAAEEWAESEQHNPKDVTDHILGLCGLMYGSVAGTPQLAPKMLDTKSKRKAKPPASSNIRSESKPPMPPPYDADDEKVAPPIAPPPI